MFCNDFSSVFRFFYKCFRRIFHLPSDVCYKIFIWMFQSRSSVAHLARTRWDLVRPLTEEQPSRDAKKAARRVMGCSIARRDRAAKGAQ
jgi:hypothetical protein